MIIAHLYRNQAETQEITEANSNMLYEAIWLDLISPTKEDEDLVEKVLKLDIPTREEMREIELSNRLYKENEAIFMTATVISHSDTMEPRIDPVSFVLTDHQLITVRYADPKTFGIFTEQMRKAPNIQRSAPDLLIDLLEAHINRLADILELIDRRLNEYSKAIFSPLSENDQRPNYLHYMQQIGSNGDLNSKARESLSTFHRLIHYYQHTTETYMGPEDQFRLTSMSKDITALNDNASFLSNKITFLLDATLGLINIEQNNIIKIFSVAAVIFLPPTLIASLYGMNFQFMPELNWQYGYIFAIVLMLLAAWLPYKYFKRRKWL